jgi:hypothetical protein
MAAPAETVTHGTAQTYLGISDEPASSPTVKVSELEKTYSSDLVETKNINTSTVYAVETNRGVELSYKGQLNADTGLANAAPGSAVATVANFGAVERTFDYAVGIFVLRDIVDSIKNLDRSPNTSFKIKHLQFTT